MNFKFLIFVLYSFSLSKTLVDSLEKNENKICEVVSIRLLDIYTDIIKLKCDWKSYIDTIPNIPLKNSKQFSNKTHVFEIEFTSENSSLSTNQPVYKKITKNLFTNLKLRSLSFKNLKIKEIESDAFDKECCKTTLESLDLSNNNLTRISTEVLKNLRRLEKLNLANNRLHFSDKHFQFNPNLNHIDFSSNELQYLPLNIFYNLNELEEINFTNNHLSDLNWCIFSEIQSNEITQKFNRARISLKKNPIDCDCSVFYMSRYARFKMELTCDMPKVYANRSLSSLYLEDPSRRCNYPLMSQKCHQISFHYKLDLHWTIVICLTIVLLVIGLIFCCSKVASENKQIVESNKNINQAERCSKKSNHFNHSTSNDTQQLIVSY